MIPPPQPVVVARSGVVAAQNAGLARAKGDIIAITDDDAEPASDWIARIEAHYRKDGRVGGVGGRDILPSACVERLTNVIGRVQWFGRVIGNHHLGSGDPVDVDVLKGVNSSYRRSALGNLQFDERLRGDGAQPFHELALGLQLRRAGWRLVYDPKVTVNHYPAWRDWDDPRGGFSSRAVQSAAHNDTLIILEHLPRGGRVAYVGWASLFGTHEFPGMVHFALLLLRRRRHAGSRFAATWRGRTAGWRSWRMYR